ncbi:uncharacterized protein [Amphiura filiformis]|uniref:uncharacterized protein n=1 Tax=Amphiura filiformis TaxID=82378 RepID=UPI003B21B8C7
MESSEENKRGSWGSGKSKLFHFNKKTEKEEKLTKKKSDKRDKHDKKSKTVQPVEPVSHKKKNRDSLPEELSPKDVSNINENVSKDKMGSEQPTPTPLSPKRVSAVKNMVSETNIIDSDKIVSSSEQQTFGRSILQKLLFAFYFMASWFTLQ